MENWNRDQRKSKVDESSSKSNSVLGREEGFGSASFTSGTNFEEGSSSSHNHVNNVEEEQRLRMLLRQCLRHTQHTDPSSSSINTKKARVYRPGSRFLPTNLGCVRVHLRNKVEKNKSGFITTLDLYKDDPWLLDHVHNDLFLRGEWYYFTPRNKRGASSCIRSVQGRGGGTWKTTTKKKQIKDKDEKVQGYMQSLVYNKTDVNGDVKPTGWNMKEYCLHKGNQDVLVLCNIKRNLRKIGFVEEVENNILSNQVQDHEEEEEEDEEEQEEEEEEQEEEGEEEEVEAGANGVEMRTLEEDHGDATQQQQEQDAPPVPVLECQGLGVEMVMMTTTTKNNDQNLMTMLKEDHGDATQQQQEQDAPPVLFVSPNECQNSEMTFHNSFMTMLQLNPGEQQQRQQEQDAPPPHEGQDSGFERMMKTMLQEDLGDTTQQQLQQEQDAPVLVFPPYEGQELGLETTENSEEMNIMAMLEEDQQNPLYFDVNKLLDDITEDDVNGDLQEQISQVRDAVRGSSDQVTFTSD